jgi:hypothetical protein
MTGHRLFASATLAVATLAACHDLEGPEEPPPMSSMSFVPMRRSAGASLPYDKTWQVGTHNSFWAERQGGDPYASGPRERILDQLLADRGRALEFDLHRGDTPHSFRVYHGIPGDSQCDTLAECLALVRMFHRTRPEHQPVLLFLEFKELFRPVLDDDYTPEDLDRILEAELGPLLYRPADFLAACGPLPISLSACQRLVGWPSLADLKGRVLVTVMGNWDQLGGQNTVAFAAYATGRDIRTRTGFPMIGSWQLDWSKLEMHVQERVPQETLQTAYAQSLFFQATGPDDTLAFTAEQAGRIIRMDNTFSVEEQEKVLTRNVQVIQTDTLLVRYGEVDPDLPFTALPPAVSSQSLREAGNRLSLLPSADQSETRVFAYTQVAAESTTEWETVVSVGVDEQRVGCLRAATALEPGNETSVTLCRHLLPVAPGPDSGAQELRLARCESGMCTTEAYKSADGTPGGSGELIAMTVKLRGDQSCVALKSARLVDKELRPLWTALGGERCLPGMLRYQGLARLGVPAGSQLEPVYFFNTRRNGQPLAATELTTR